MSAADFLVNSVANPARHTTTYGASVSLALASTTGVLSVSWSVASKSHSSLASPTITPAGSPLGATATFTFPSSITDGEGRSLRIQCSVTTAAGNYTTYGVVGVEAASGFLPFCPDETTEREASRGWTDEANDALTGFVVKRSNTVTTTNSTATTIDSATVVNGTVTFVRAVVFARQNATNQAAYDLRAVFSTDSAACALIGAVDQLAREDTAGWDATLDTSANSIRVRVTGTAATTVQWRVNWYLEHFTP